MRDVLASETASRLRRVSRQKHKALCVEKKLGTINIGGPWCDGITFRFGKTVLSGESGDTGEAICSALDERCCSTGLTFARGPLHVHVNFWTCASQSVWVVSRLLDRTA